MFNRLRIVVILTALLLACQTASADVLTFKSGDQEDVKILSWKDGGIKVKDRNGGEKFYYYVEIRKINDDSLQDIGMQLAFLRALSGARDSVVHFFKGFMRHRFPVDENGQTIKSRRDVCKGTKGKKSSSTYDEFGRINLTITCENGQKTSMKMYRRDGSIRMILQFRSNKITDVFRYSKSGEKIEPPLLKGKAFRGEF